MKITCTFRGFALLVVLTGAAVCADSSSATTTGVSVLRYGSCTGVSAGLSGQDKVIIDKTMNSIAPCHLTVTIFFTDTTFLPDMFFSENVINKSDIKWSDYHFVVGQGFGDSFRESDNNDGIHFRNELGSIPSNPDFGPVAPPVVTPGGTDLGPDELDFEGGSGVMAGASTRFGFTVAGLRDANGDGVDGDHQVSFTLRQTPTIAEPDSLALVALAVAALGLSRRRRPSLPV